jgi:hypothetical protein
MKKLLLLLSILASQLTRAQETIPSFYGLKAGPGFYTISPGGDGVSGRTGLHAGIWYRHNITPVFSTQTELLFSMEGWKFSDNVNTISNKFNYLQLPVLLQFRTRYGLYIETGPQVGLRLSGKQEADNNNGAIDFFPIDTWTNRWIFSGAVGAGYLKGKIGLGTRYNFGITSLLKNQDGRSNGLAVSLLYAFQ